ncbi:MAG TPA: zf-HC2 domain-containing protein [bacterium]|nr:zf-HC2 domain-containing protein [bacterium]
MRKRKKTTNERRECTKGHELIAEYVLGRMDTEPTSDELRLHVKSCTNCKRLLLRLEPLVPRSLEPQVRFRVRPDREMPVAVGEEFALSPLREQGTECRECTEVHALIAEYVSGEPNEGFPLELLLHLLSCPNCDWLMPVLVQVVRTGTLPTSREMPMEVRRDLWIKIRGELRSD